MVGVLVLNNTITSDGVDQRNLSFYRGNLIIAAHASFFFARAPFKGWAGYWWFDEHELCKVRLRKNGFKASNTGYFVYCNGNMDKEAFDERLEFDVKIVSYEGDPSWVEKMILEAIECLKSEKLPPPGSDCDICKYRRAVRQAMSRFEK